jgi:hypothetical protein
LRGCSRRDSTRGGGLLGNRLPTSTSSAQKAANIKDSTISYGPSTKTFATAAVWKRLYYIASWKAQRATEQERFHAIAIRNASVNTLSLPSNGSPLPIMRLPRLPSESANREPCHRGLRLSCEHRRVRALSTALLLDVRQQMPSGLPSSNRPGARTNPIRGSACHR